MKIRKHIYFQFIISIVVLIIYSQGANAQFGIIKGKVTDKVSKEPIPFATVLLEKDGKKIISSSADFDGNYTIDSIPVGTYNLKIKNWAYDTFSIKNLTVKNDSIFIKDIYLKYNEKFLLKNCGGVWLVPLINRTPSPTGQTFTTMEINKMAW